MMNFDEIPLEVHTSLKKYTRILLLMLAAYSFGASIGIFTNYLFKIEQLLLAGTTSEFGNFLYGAMTTRERSEIYLGCLRYCFVLMFSGFAFILLDGYSALWMIKIHTVQTLFMGYLVVYSQEILYNANFGDINFVNCTFTVFFHLPAVVIQFCKTIPAGCRN